MDLFSERDRRAIVRQLRAEEAGSRNNVAYFSALLEELQAAGGDSPENEQRERELRSAIDGAKARADEKASEIERWERA